MSKTFCPRCGAEFPIEVLGELIRTSVRCPDCRLALTEVPSTLAPSDDEIAYELDDWAVPDRASATAGLVDAGISYRWEEGLVLVVREEAEADVDALLERAGADDASAAAGDEAAADEYGDDGEDGGEEAHQAMSDLFVAADRLQHAGFDEGAAADLVAAADIVASSRPPYGIDDDVWREIRDLASTVVSGLEEKAEDDVVAADARVLREFLRDYI